MVVRHVNTSESRLGRHSNTGWAALTARPTVGESRRGKSKRVRIGRRCALVAGADSSIRQLLRTVLEIAGFEVVEAASQPEVLARLAGAVQMPQVIVVDVLLPGFAGLQTVSYIRRDPRLADVPIIVLTSFGEQVEQQRFLQHGATRVLTKPFSSQRLLDLVTQIATVN